MEYILPEELRDLEEIQINIQKEAPGSSYIYPECVVYPRIRSYLLSKSKKFGITEQNVDEVIRDAKRVRNQGIRYFLQDILWIIEYSLTSDLLYPSVTCYACKHYRFDKAVPQGGWCLYFMKEYTPAHYICSYFEEDENEEEKRRKISFF